MFEVIQSLFLSHYYSCIYSFISGFILIFCEDFFFFIFGYLQLCCSSVDSSKKYKSDALIMCRVDGRDAQVGTSIFTMLFDTSGKPTYRPLNVHYTSNCKVYELFLVNFFPFILSCFIYQFFPIFMYCCYFHFFC